MNAVAGSLDQVALLRPVTKCVFDVRCVGDIPAAIQQAFATARSGEPGPAAVVIPYNLLLESHDYNVPPPPGPELPWDEAAASRAIGLLANRKLRVGIYAGQGCMDHPLALCQVAELLQAPVATTVSGKGVIPESHPLAVGWGYGPQGTRTAERAFRDVDCLLALGVRFSEVATGYYSNPRPRRLIHVDANACNLGRVLTPDVGVPADAGLFLDYTLAHAEQVWKSIEAERFAAAKAEWAEQTKKAAAEAQLELTSARATWEKELASALGKAERRK